MNDEQNEAGKSWRPLHPAMIEAILKAVSGPAPRDPEWDKLTNKEKIERIQSQGFRCGRTKDYE